MPLCFISAQWQRIPTLMKLVSLKSQQAIFPYNQQPDYSWFARRVLALHRQ